MSRRVRRAFARSFPDRLELVPHEDWPETAQLDDAVQEVWRSQNWVVLVFAARAGAVRLSVRSVSGRDGITWDQLQAVKREIGHGDAWALEVYPPDAHLIDVAPMRHLFITDAPPWAWRRSL